MKYDQDAQDIRQFIKSKDHMSCHNLVSRHQDAVFRTCFGVLKNRQVAEEVAQDVFVKAFNQLGKLDDPVKFRAWILRMAYYSSIDHWRRQKKPMLDEGNRAATNEEPGPDEKLDAAKRSKLISSTINDLGEPDTSIFTLFYLEEMKISEISEILELSESNIKIRLMRGRQVLKQKLGEILKQY